MAMTTLARPSFERRLLRTVRDEAEEKAVREWPPQSLQLCLDLVRKMRENAARMRPTLERVLADGVEARSFTRDFAPLLAGTDDQIATVRDLIERLSPAEGAATERL